MRSPSPGPGPSLFELQSRFQQVLKGDVVDCPAEWISGRDTPPIPFQRRIGIYHEGGEIRFELAMADDFPAVQAIVGEERFARMVKAYLNRFPSRYPSLAEIGADFEKYLAGEGAIAEFPFLDELAAFEWRRVLCHWAGQPPPVDFAALQRAAAESPESVVLTLHPGTFLVESRWPLDRLGSSSRPGKQGVRLVIFRQGGCVTHERLAARAWHLLRELQRGTALGDLEPCMKRHRIPPDQALRLIGSWVESGVIGGFRRTS